MSNDNNNNNNMMRKQVPLYRSYSTEPRREPSFHEVRPSVSFETPIKVDVEHVYVVVQGFADGLRQNGKRNVFDFRNEGNPLEISDFVWRELVQTVEEALDQCNRCNRNNQGFLMLLYVVVAMTMVGYEVAYDVFMFVMILMFIVFSTLAVLMAQSSFYLETLLEEHVAATMEPSLVAEGYHICAMTDQNKFTGPITYLRFSRLNTRSK